jgi:hypothetical protein
VKKFWQTNEKMVAKIWQGKSPNDVRGKACRLKYAAFVHDHLLWWFAILPASAHGCSHNGWLLSGERHTQVIR